jgi:hypothetical protein
MSHWCGATPSVRRKACEKLPTDRPHSRATPERYTALNVGAKNFRRASLLPWRKPTPGRPRHWPHASIGLSDMHPERQQDVVEKQQVSLVGMPEVGGSNLPRLQITRSLTPTPGF